MPCSAIDTAQLSRRIATAVNGKIVAVTAPCCKRLDVVEHFRNPRFLQSMWGASFSSQELREGVNIVTAYVILEDGEKTLAALRTSGRNIIYKSTSKANEASPFLGKLVTNFTLELPSTVKGRLDTISRPDGEENIIFVRGWAAFLDGPRSRLPDQILVAVNGEITAVVPPCCERPDVAQSLRNDKFLRSGWVAAFLVEDLKEGWNNIEAYVVLDASAKKLTVLGATPKNHIFRSGLEIRIGEAH